MHDRHVRYPDDPGPLWPGRPDLRFTLVDRSDPDLIRLRQDVQEEGRGLFVARAGGTGVKCLLEAYYPEDIRPAYADKQLDRYRLAEFKMGRLVVIARHFNWFGEIDPVMLDQMRRNNRNARKDLRRSHSPTDHRLALERDLAEKEKAAYDAFEDFYTHAMIDTHKFAMAKKHISQHTPRGRR